MTKKKFFSQKMEIFTPENVILKSWVRRKKFSVPQTWRQVSSTDVKAALA